MLIPQLEKSVTSFLLLKATRKYKRNYVNYSFSCMNKMQAISTRFKLLNC